MPELKAIFIGYRYTSREKTVNMSVISDKITAVSYVINKGRIKSEFCNKIAKKLWL